MKFVEIFSKSKEEKEDFKIECKDVKSCSRVEKPILAFPRELWLSIVTLAEVLDTEWIGYLTGSFEGNIARFDSLYFPPQNPSGAHVKPIEDPTFQIRPSTIGCIHSHVRMEAKFSSTDKANANWPFEIVVNARGEYEANARVKLPCGEFMRTDATIDLDVSDLAMTLYEEVAKAIQDGKEKEEKEEREEISRLPLLAVKEENDYLELYQKEKKRYNKKKRNGKLFCQTYGCFNELGERSLSGFCDRCWEEFFAPPDDDPPKVKISL